MQHKQCNDDCDDSSLDFITLSNTKYKKKNQNAIVLIGLKIVIVFRMCYECNIFRMDAPFVYAFVVNRSIDSQINIALLKRIEGIVLKFELNWYIIIY